MQLQFLSTQTVIFALGVSVLILRARFAFDGAILGQDFFDDSDDESDNAETQGDAETQANAQPSTDTGTGSTSDGLSAGQPVEEPTLQEPEASAGKQQA